MALLPALSRLVPPVSAQDIILATPTSTRDIGLLDSLLPQFERVSGLRVKVIAVGSGQALEMGKRGDADVVLSHAPAAERALLEAGYFTSRRPMMRNVFLLVGPRADPASVRGERSVVAAFARLSQMGSPFVSRGDRSGSPLSPSGEGERRSSYVPHSRSERGAKGVRATGSKG